MRSEREGWCKNHCPIYPGYGQCLLDIWLEDGWPSSERKKEIRREFDELAEKDPDALIRECLGKSFSG